MTNLGIQVITDLIDPDNFENFNSLKGLRSLFPFLKNQKLKQNFKKMDVKSRTMFEEATKNIFLNFDKDERDPFLWLIFNNIDKFGTETLDEKANKIFLISKMNPGILKIIRIVFNYQNKLGFCYKDDIKKERYINEADWNDAINMGLISNTEPKSNLGNIANTHSLTHRGMEMLRLQCWKESTEVFIKDLIGYNNYLGFDHDHVIPKENHFNFKNVLDTLGLLTKEFMKLDSQKYKEITPQALIQSELSNIPINLETIIRLSIEKLEKIFKNEFLDFFSVEYLLIFNEKLIGLDKIWRALSFAYKKLKEMLEGDMKIFDIQINQVKIKVHDLAAPLNDALFFRAQKLKRTNRVVDFYYEFS